MEKITPQFSTDRLLKTLEQNLNSVELDTKKQFNNIGEILLNKNVISDEQLGIALELQESTNENSD